MNKKNILIIILVGLMLTSIFWVISLKTEIQNKERDYNSCFEERNLLIREKEDLRECFLDELFFIHRNVINCHTLECYEKWVISSEKYNQINENCKDK